MKYLITISLLMSALALALFLSMSPVPVDSAQEPPATRPENTLMPPADDPLVVLELFTSQGCSSCPPADALLQDLNERALAGENIIALSYHVDYWNYLGWKDPFSSADYSARQKDYTRRIGARTYTPQLVVNGKEELVGSRRAEVNSLVERGLKNAHPDHSPSLSVAYTEQGVEVGYQLAGPTDGYRVSALIVQHEARSAVNRGENRGRKLNHHNVVRVLEHQNAAAEGSFRLQLPEGLPAEDVSVVLLVQEVKSHAISGAAQAAVSAR